MLSRRRLLQYFGASSMLPLLPPLEARAQSATVPKRLVVFYSSGGTVREQWLPTMINGTLTLGPILAPLESHKSQLLVVDGLGYYSSPGGFADGHYGVLPASLTGSVPVVVDSSNGTTQATGISIDQAIANAIGAQNPVRSLQLGVGVEMLAPDLDTLSYAGDRRPLRPQNDPFATYQRIFGGVMPLVPGAQAAQQLVKDRKSVLDFVTFDLGRLKSVLGTSDRSKLDAHLEGVRQLENALAAAPPPSSCGKPSLGTAVDVNANDNIPALSKASIDMLVAALACDLTRVATLQHGRAGALHRHTWLGPDFSFANSDGTTGVHGLAHANGNPGPRQLLARCNTWYAGQVAYLMDRLKSVPEGNGTLADNTLVLWMNEFGNGGAHDKTQIPYVLLGSLGGHFKTGQLVSFPGKPHNALLVSLGQAFGLPLTSFGAPAFNWGALPNIT